MRAAYVGGCETLLQPVSGVRAVNMRAQQGERGVGQCQPLGLIRP